MIWGVPAVTPSHREESLCHNGGHSDDHWPKVLLEWQGVKFHAPVDLDRPGQGEPAGMRVPQRQNTQTQTKKQTHA